MHQKKGIIFWIEGLSGSGKTSIAKKILKKINQDYGKTIIINGDDLRKIFNLRDYSKVGRAKNFRNYTKFAKFLSNQNLNVIFTVVGLNPKLCDQLNKNVKNLVRILIKADIRKIVKFGKKKIYKKNDKNIVGLGIKTYWPKKIDIKIKNNFTKSIDQLSDELYLMIQKNVK